MTCEIFHVPKAEFYNWLIQTAKNTWDDSKPIIHIFNQAKIYDVTLSPYTYSVVFTALQSTGNASAVDALYAEIQKRGVIMSPALYPRFYTRENIH